MQLELDFLKTIQTTVARIFDVRWLHVVLGLAFCMQGCSSDASGTTSTAVPASPINVSKNVQISVDSDKRIHDEAFIGADPKNPSELIACVINTLAGAKISALDAYRSSDAGTSWHLAGQFGEDHIYADPICSFGVSGTAYFGGLGGGLNPDLTPDRGSLGIWFHRFAPNGKLLPRVGLGGADRPYLSVDYNSEKHRGNVYISGQYVTLRPLQIGMALWASHDDGRNFGAPATTYTFDKGAILLAGQNAVLRNGTVAIAFLAQPPSHGLLPPSPSQPGVSFTSTKIFVATSIDGGKTLSEPVLVTTVKQDDYQCGAFGSGCLIQLAADDSDGPYGGRLYMAWNNFADGRTRVRV